MCNGVQTKIKIAVLKLKKKIRGTTAPKSQDRLKRLLPMAVQWALWLAKRYPSTLISVFFTGYGAKGDWDFRISDLVKNPVGTDI